MCRIGPGTGTFHNTPTGYIKGSGTLNTATTSFTNNGHISPGASAGILAITGNLSQSSTSAVDIEIGGGAAGIGYDLLKVSGTATLDGILNISLANGYTPQAGDSYYGTFGTLLLTLRYVLFPRDKKGRTGRVKKGEILLLAFAVTGR